MRRHQVRSSTALAGLTPRCCQPSATSASMAWVTESNCRGGRSAVSTGAAVIAAIHSRTAPRSASVSCFFGGMCCSASGKRFLKSRLSSGFPATTTAPSSPPFSNIGRVSSSKPLFLLQRAMALDAVHIQQRLHLAGPQQSRVCTTCDPGGAEETHECDGGSMVHVQG